MIYPKLLTLLIIGGIGVTTAIGFGIRKWALEHQYKKQVDKDRKTFNLCIQEASTNEEMQNCYLKIQQGK